MNDSYTRTDGQQAAIEVCAFCHAPFAPKQRGNSAQRFCKPKCRAAYSREVGLVGAVVSVRRLKTRHSVMIHTTDDRILQSPIGTKFRLVKEG